MPLVQTRGAASAQGFGEFAQASGPANYIEDVFSTYLYTGTGASQTITNNINTTTYGGLTWIKGRSGATGHRLTDTTRGVTKSLESNSTAAETTETTGLTAFGTTGFTIGADADYNTSAATYVSWTFLEQPKFFDIVTYTGTGANRTIAHSLGSVPGCIMVKRTDTTGAWQVYHSSLANTQYLVLNTTAAVATGATRWNSTTPTSTVFSLGTDTAVNASGGTYVAYIYAHNAGGFGLTGTNNVISCGSYTGNGSATGPIVTLGYEPQWLMIKNSSSTGNWQIIDNMRAMTVGTTDATLQANLSNAETAVGYVSPTSTGFQITSTNTEVNTNTNIYIYIAIRRGPMKVPTDATKVFSPVVQTASVNSVVTTGFPVDLSMSFSRDGVAGTSFFDRLRGSSTTSSVLLTSSSTAAESSSASYGIGLQSNTTIVDNYNAELISPGPLIYWNFRRAPSFFDEVCYTGTGSATTFSHNLGVAPELMIVKIRDAAVNWIVYNAPSGASYRMFLNTTSQESSTNSQLYWGNGTIAVAPTSSVFSIGSGLNLVNQTGNLYVAYLFATAAGVSKVGSYTGNGTTQTINCGFTGGARFVIIKRTDAASGWYVYDTARGMTVLTDPYMFLNSTAADSSTLGSVTTVSTGFALNSTILADINISSGTYLFLAIA